MCEIDLAIQRSTRPRRRLRQAQPTPCDRQTGSKSPVASSAAHWNTRMLDQQTQERAEALGLRTDMSSDTYRTRLLRVGRALTVSLLVTAAMASCSSDIRKGSGASSI